MTADDLREYFSKFGEVTDVFVPRPFRAFGFVTFLDPEVAQSLCGEDHVIKGASVSVSSAAPKIKTKSQNWKEDSYGPNNWEGNRSGGSSGGPSNNGGNSNIDSLNMQNLGINPNGGPPANFNLPISLVAAALNQAGWGGFLGGPGNSGPNNWQGGPPQGNPGKNWNGNQNWGQNGPPPSWNQGGGNPGWNGGGKSGNNWNQGNWPNGQGNWNSNGNGGGSSSGSGSGGWNNNKPQT